jgi:branched-chain amino acid transport system permease protein
MAMSGYLSGTLAILCINLIFAYGIFITAVAGQINLGGAGFQAIGAYATAWLASQSGAPMWVIIPAATLISALVGFLISLPVLRTRGVYMVLATFAFGEVVAGFLLRSEIFGGAIGMVVPQHAELWVLIASAVMTTLAAFYLMATRHGLAMRSLNDDEYAASMPGRSRSPRLPSVAHLPGCRARSMPSTSALSRRNTSTRCCRSTCFSSS